MNADRLKLVIGNKNYSSWSLRPWILMQHAGLSFEEVSIPLFTPAAEALLEEWCPAKRVPVLHEGPLVLWDSLAICEYIADKVAGRSAEQALWPERSAERARARAMSAEMHAGFVDMREAMPMNCRRRVENFQPSLAVQIDINRIVQLFEDALQQSGGPWLFTHYTVADAMYAPIVSRFHTYGIAVPKLSRRYMQHVLDDPAMRQWYQAAAAETRTIEQFEIGR